MLSDIAAYTFKADIYKPDEIVAEVCRARGIEGHGLSTDPEEALNLVARFEGINRYDESSFDSDEFPKVVFEDQYRDYLRTTEEQADDA